MKELLCLKVELEGADSMIAELKIAIGNVTPKVDESGTFKFNDKNAAIYIEKLTILENKRSVVMTEYDQKKKQLQKIERIIKDLDFEKNNKKNIILKLWIVKGYTNKQIIYHLKKIGICNGNEDRYIKRIKAEFRKNHLNEKK